MPKKETAQSVLPHTEAKLQFYTQYLARYLAILLRSSHVEQINIYDMFCGEGTYSDGNTGSAVRAVEAIWKAQSPNANSKSINLHLNDLDKAKTDKLRIVLDSRESVEKNFRISYSNTEAAELLGKLPSGFKSQNSKVRNLVFIDPYGYKDISRSSLEALLALGRTEVILFLPIEQIYRFFSKTTTESVDNSYKPLKRFVEQFEIDITQIHSEKSLVAALATVLAFNNELYSTSYSIKNHTGHYYGMFFITSNLLGLEKIIEVKWGLDTQEGSGFSGTDQQDFFLETDIQDHLKNQLTVYLSDGEKTNIELYEFVLKSGFMAKHANAFFKGWQAEGRLRKFDLKKGKAAAKNTFKLTYDEYKTGIPSIRYSLNDKAGDNE
ncbi:MAG: three-Cys-motif partner protein TcmP [Neptuniibacter sp.]